jgi:hypothetical protein
MPPQSVASPEDETMRDSTRDFTWLFLVAGLLMAVACAEDAPVTSPPTVIEQDQPAPEDSRSIIASVECVADVSQATLACGDVPLLAVEAGPQRVILGGQDQYVRMGSGPVSYDSETGIFQASVWLVNLIQQGLGSPDGIQLTGVRVFYHDGPTVTDGTGAVTVHNPDGYAAFTGTDQPYYLYDVYLAYNHSSGGKVWQWHVPSTVTTFTFSVYVAADVLGEQGYVEMSLASAQLTVGGSVTVAGVARDVVGRPLGSTVTYTSTDLSVATVHPSTGVVTAVGTGVATIIGTTGGPEANGITAVAVPSSTGYDIDFHFLTPVTAGQRQIFLDAAARWEGLIADDVATEWVTSTSLSCAGTIDEYVDDLTIRVLLTEIDGPEGILGGAAPCWVRYPMWPEIGLPAYGVMIFDVADVGLTQFPDVVLHEMGHVLGIGTLWRENALLADDAGTLWDCFPGSDDPPPPLTTDPFFNAPYAQAAFDAAGGSAYTGNKVPVEDAYGEGTRCVHWRETVLDTELMTGFAEGAGVTMPLSEITVKSLADLGYGVEMSGWDAFTCTGCTPPEPGAAAVDALTGGLPLLNDVLPLPVYARDSAGRVFEVQPGVSDAIPLRR